MFLYPGAPLEFLGGISNGIITHMELLTPSSLWENKAKQINTFISFPPTIPLSWLRVHRCLQPRGQPWTPKKKPKSHCSQAIMPFDGRGQEEKCRGLLICQLYSHPRLQRLSGLASSYHPLACRTDVLACPETLHSSLSVAPPYPHEELTSPPNSVCLSQLRVTLFPSSLTMGRWLKYDQPIYSISLETWPNPRQKDQIPDLWSYWKSKAAQLRERWSHLNPWIHLGPKLCLNLSVMGANKCPSFICIQASLSWDDLTHNPKNSN